MTNLDTTLSALADPTRRKIVDHLRRRPRRAGELATRIRMSPPALSRHLRVLRKSGLIEEQRSEDDARLRVYRLRRKPFKDLDMWLREIESMWESQLAAFKAHAEQQNPPAKRTAKRAPRADRETRANKGTRAGKKQTRTNRRKRDD